MNADEDHDKIVPFRQGMDLEPGQTAELIIVLPVECQVCGGPLLYAESVQRSDGQTHVYHCSQGHEVSFDSGDE